MSKTDAIIVKAYGFTPIEKWEAPMKSKRKPHNQDAGYICELIFKPSHSHIVIYRAAEQNIEQEQKYVVVCSKHGTNVAETNVPSARLSMKYPEFCDECMKGVRS